MFRCDKCELVTGPRIKPILVPKETRSVAYSVERRNDDGDLMPGMADGQEVTGEYLVCPSCCGIEIKAPVEPNWAGLRQAINLFTKNHVRNCKRDLADCNSCQHFIRDLDTMPLPAIAEALQQSQEVPMLSSFALVAVASIQRRVNHQSKRAEADFNAAYTHLAPYASRGGGL